MHTIDMHCDTLIQAYFGNILHGRNDNIYDLPNCAVDLKRLHKSGAMAQFFAIFLPDTAVYTRWKIPPMEDEVYISSCASLLERSVAAHTDIVALANNADDIRRNHEDGKVSAVLTMEDGRAIAGNLENLKRFYDMGVRAVGLTWNHENCLGAPNSRDPEIMGRGLTAFGKEAVGYMQELGMLIDVSHLSDGGFYDVAQLCKKPFVATHSNCRAICPHPRNLTDDMIRTLSDHGGVMGINFGPEFLSEDPKKSCSTVERMVAMACHERKVGGIDVIALGSDLDGIEGNLEIDSCDKMELLVSGLSRNGFTENEIEKIFYRNVLRVMEDAVN